MNRNIKMLLVISVILSLAALSGGPASAQGKKAAPRDAKAAAFPAKAGTVDYLTLVVFHPYMQYYSFEDNTFIRPLKEGVPATEILGKIRERQEKYAILKQTKSQQISILQQELESVEAELNKIRVKASREQSAINLKYTEEYTKLSGEKERKEKTDEYHKRLLKLDEDFYLEKKKFEERKSEILKSVYENYNQLQEINYLNESDAKEFFEGMVGEINSVVAEVAAEKKFLFVMNSNFVAGIIRPESFAPGQQDPSPAAQPADSAKVANYSSIVEGIDDFGAGTPSEIEAKKNATRENCNRLFLRRAEAARLFSGKGILGQTLVCGGEDITLEVLGRILKKHSVNPERVKIINETVEKLLNPQTARTEKPAAHQPPAPEIAPPPPVKNQGNESQ